MNKPEYMYDWAKLAFASKKKINDLKPVFIAASREISPKRFKQLVKTYLPHGNIVLGLAKEEFIMGFEGQPQYRTLKRSTIDSVAKKINGSESKHKLYLLEYHQRETAYLFDKLKFKKVILINGSWKYAFHTQKPYYALAEKRVDYEFVSPFCDESEAKEYEARTWEEMVGSVTIDFNGEELGETGVMKAADDAARLSFDNSFQTGAALGRATAKKGRYIHLASAFNKVVPYQTYAWHHGSSRERNFSPPNDLNHYDTVHAEVEMLLQAQKDKLDLADTTLFINLLPCPTCCRMLMETDISAVIYRSDHSDGYAISMLTKAGKKVSRLVAA